MLDAEHVVAARLAQIATASEVSCQVGGLVLTGGDVAAAVSTAPGATALWLRGEISSGIPWGRLEGGNLPGRSVATKAEASATTMQFRPASIT